MNRRGFILGTTGLVALPASAPDALAVTVTKHSGPFGFHPTFTWNAMMKDSWADIEWSDVQWQRASRREIESKVGISLVRDLLEKQQEVNARWRDVIRDAKG